MASFYPALAPGFFLACAVTGQVQRLPGLCGSSARNPDQATVPQRCGHPVAIVGGVVVLGLDRFASVIQHPAQPGPVQGLGVVVVRRPVPPGEAPFTMRLYEAAHLSQHGEHFAIAIATTGR